MRTVRGAFLILAIFDRFVRLLLTCAGEVSPLLRETIEREVVEIAPSCAPARRR